MDPILAIVRPLMDMVHPSNLFIRRRMADRFSHRLAAHDALNPSSSFTHQPRFEHALKRAMTQRLCGVSVLCAPEGAGKTTFLRHVANELVDSGEIRGVAYIGTYAGAFKHRVLHTWLLSQFDVKPHPSLENLCDLLPEAEVNDDDDGQRQKPYLLILDSFEDVLRHPDAPTFIKALAQNCQSSKRLTVLVSVNTTSTGEEMARWNGSTKITTLEPNDGWRWTRDELEELASKVMWNRRGVTRAAWTDIPTRVQDEILHAATTVATPGFLLGVSSKASIYYDDTARLRHDAGVWATMWAL